MLLKRTKNGLDKVNASIMDVDSSSLFDIFVPKQLRSGKNEIRLRLVNDGLAKGSDILIDILDQNYEPLYYEISEIANEDKSRSIIVYVTETDLTGKAYLYIYVKLGMDSSYLTLINLEVNPELESEQEIKFSDPPEIFYSEKRLATQTFTNQSRQAIKVNTNGSISTISPTIPRQMVESVFTVEKSEIRERKSDNTAGSGSTIELPQHFDLARIVSNNYPFSSSYKNGSIEINGINLEVPNDAITPVPFLNQNYSASIINVISTGSIEVYPPFLKVIEYQTLTGLKSKVYDRFSNQSNFTCSFFETLALSQTNYTQSYAVFDIFNLLTAAGKIDSIDISFKNLSLIGDNYEPLGNFKIRPINYLIDSSSLFFDNEKGIIERPIGTFKNGVADFQSYWQSSSLLSVTTTDSVPDGIKFSGNEVVFEPKVQFNPINHKDTEWNLSFDFNLQPSQSQLPQMDIFISSSAEIKPDALKNSNYLPYSSSNIGTYIGSVTDRTGKGSFNFRINDPSRITPKFALRRGFLSIGNVTLAPVEKIGYNASQTRIFAPLNLPTGSEVNFKIDYVNPVGKKSAAFTSRLPGVFFEGSARPTGNSSTILPPGTVSGSDQLTSSFDDRYHKLGTGLLSSSNQLAGDISGSFILYITNISNKTGSYATTGSNTFVGSQSISGSVNVSGSVRAGAFIGVFDGIPSSSAQIKPLLPAGTISSSAQIGNTGIYSGSGQVPYNTVVSASNLKFETNLNDDEWFTGIQFDVDIGASNTMFPYSGSLILYTGKDGDDARTYVRIAAEDDSIELINKITSENSTDGIHAAFGHIDAQHTSGSENTNFRLAGHQIFFEDNRNNKRGIEYLGNYTASIKDNPGSLLDSRTVKVIVSQSANLFTSSYNDLYENKGTGIFSASQQVDYNSITNKPNVSGSGLHRILMSSGSASSSFGDKNLTYDPNSGSLNLTGRFNINGPLYVTGSLTHRNQYTWSGPITVGTSPGIIWTNMPASKCTWLHSTGGSLTDDATFIGDFTELQEARLFTSVAFLAPAGTTTASLAVDYSTDGAVWNQLISVTISNTGGNKDSGWQRMNASASNFVYLRLTGQGSNGAADPRFSPPILLLR